MTPSPVRRALVLLRHGHSTGNGADAFSGWLDVPLSERGRRDAARAGELIAAHGVVPRVIHTSGLSRAIATAELAAAGSGAVDADVRRSWRLNERHYGVLQGRSRAEVRAEAGDELFACWRRSYEHAPPGGESLADVRRRLLPYWHSAVAPGVARGEVTLVVAHGNSLRALCMYLDGLDADEVARLNIPTGVPFVYEFDEGFRPFPRGGRYLDPEAARAGIAEVLAQGGAPGETLTFG
ncbi:2,3-diphosphoglycerate-dependent phosphoglycerate mutase [Actinomadura syzygii]|uniref:2,3-bisphosphoglycerate-dependent phosphoglycerate mutase n=1 Tax=Actinomadura syzygii TaxID=1427538 RepID=A0A5D0U5E0_9ACTN|nr:2,3-bisphosphoglycerate-dependent phosphoglycerate mutase [Actinomadura syzygii]TYC13174.1 2,3-bisphosphoglycerate-dependent phosphoglycerate mutase [Actinomadura syzygii]